MFSPSALHALAFAIPILITLVVYAVYVDRQPDECEPERQRKPDQAASDDTKLWKRLRSLAGSTKGFPM